MVSPQLKTIEPGFTPTYPAWKSSITSTRMATQLRNKKSFKKTRMMTIVNLTMMMRMRTIILKKANLNLRSQRKRKNDDVQFEPVGVIPIFIPQFLYHISYKINTRVINRSTKTEVAHYVQYLLA